jgi:hypothetical protein
MTDAGWKNVNFQRWDGEITVAPSIDAAANFMVNMTSASRLLAGAGIDHNVAVGLIADKLKPLAGADGKVRAPAACWIVTAKA